MATTARPAPSVSTRFPAPGVAAALQRAIAASAGSRGPVASDADRNEPAGVPYPKIPSGRKAETIQFGASTISLIRRSAATLATT